VKFSVQRFLLNGNLGLRMNLAQQEACAWRDVFRESGYCSCRASTTLAQGQFAIQPFWLNGKLGLKGGVS
jgi:hypothetical protein